MQRRTRKWELGFKKIDKFELRTPCTTSFTPLTPRASHLNLKNSWLKKFKLKFFFPFTVYQQEKSGAYLYVDLSPIKHQRNTKLKTQQRKRKRKRYTTSKQSPHNQETQDLTWSAMCLRPRGGEKSLLKTEKKIQELRDFSLTTLNGEKQNFS